MLLRTYYQKMKRQLKECEEVSGSYVSSKSLIFRIYKKLLQL